MFLCRLDGKSRQGVSLIALISFPFLWSLAVLRDNQKRLVNAQSGFFALYPEYAAESW